MAEEEEEAEEAEGPEAPHIDKLTSPRYRPPFALREASANHSRGRMTSAGDGEAPPVMPMWISDHLPCAARPAILRHMGVRCGNFRHLQVLVARRCADGEQRYVDIEGPSRSSVPASTTNTPCTAWPVDD